MQKVLSFKVGKKKYVSKPWNFEALCRVQEVHVKRETESLGRLCGDAVDCLFEGTEATQDVLDAATADKMRMCREVWKWYLDDMTAMSKNTGAATEEEAPEAAEEN